jgi:uncharacterized protein (TIGR02246 family)
MRSALAALLLCVALADATAQSTQAAEATPKDKDAFKSLVATHAAAINSRDGAAVAATFTQNGDEVFMSDGLLTGRATIRDASNAALAGWPQNRRFDLTLTSARMLNPNVAILETEATFSDGAVPPNRGTMVVVRERGHWLITALRVYPAVAK